jgi:hypothetical protein
MWPRACSPGALPAAYKGHRPLLCRPPSPKTLARARAALPPNPSAAAAVNRPSAALPSPRRSPGTSLQGKERDGVTCCHPRALHRRSGVAGVAPPQLAAPPHLAPSPPPRRPPVEFACSCYSSRCFPRGKWGTLAPKPLCAGDSAAGRRRSRAAAGRPPPPGRVCSSWTA